MNAILPLGDPRLRQIAEPVVDLEAEDHRADRQRLVDALVAFRRAHGFGRAIAAPQLGIPRRLVALDLGDGPRVVVNPRIVAQSARTFTLWDDCMCFPWLLVRVRRAVAVRLAWVDERGDQEWDVADPAVAELLQHELDHLDGVLATDRALDPRSLVSREAWEADPPAFRAMVDGWYEGGRLRLR